ncbi:MAG: 50S ribosomal protein L44e [Thermoprotei archaeon]|nr:MAG: 50S ribosomal protein L44e [Thermoprotei archaeon]RLF19198.1 MAG: 50S ribosomal protein L44e [Thermoprotei archaeon]
MKIPRAIRTYCPRCNRHTVHTVSIYKHGKRRTLAAGQRRYLAKQKGYGSKRKPEQKRFAKTTKKVVFKLTCNECGYVLLRGGIRLKRVEIIR